jgi:hypothetical protein
MATTPNTADIRTATNSATNNAKNYVGLCDAMNSYEKSLVAAGIVEYANQYEIQFAPAGTLANATITPKGNKEKSSTSVAKPATAGDVVNPDKQSYDKNSQRFSIIAGQQIIQQIGIILQNSSYITDQQKAVLDPTEVDQAATPQSAKTKTTNWFRVSVNAVPMGNIIDKKRNDYPYKITYIVTTYAINQMQSQYFNDAKFRGIHKAYDYWFTGNNTQVLNYEQSYNNQFFYVMGSRDKMQGPQSAHDPDPKQDYIAQGLGKPTAVPSPPTGSTQGSTNDANTPSATAVDYLYSMADQGTVKLSIVGDPAWLLQGEIKGITANSINFDGFYPDGSVCYETQEVIFSINFNAPTDYNNAPGYGGPVYGTGLIDTFSSAQQVNGSPVSTRASAAYRATTVKSTFSRGIFTQELSGTALTNLNPKMLSSTLTDNGRQSKNNTTLPAMSGVPGNGSVRSNPNVVGMPTQPASAITPAATIASVVSTESGYPPDTGPQQSSTVATPPLQPLAISTPTSNGDALPTTNSFVNETSDQAALRAKANTALAYGSPTSFPAAPKDE